MNTFKVREVAAWFEAAWDGDGDLVLTGVSGVDTAGPEHLSFAAGRKAVELAAASQAGCVLVPPQFPSLAGRALIRVEDPRGAFARSISRFHPPERLPRGIHPSAIIDPSAEFGDDCAVGPGVTIGAAARIGRGSSVGPGCRIGDRVTIGESCLLHANVVLYAGVRIGHRAVLHSGCVIGADGFGFVLSGGRYEKFPQIGNVIIGDDVEIGANSCVDRAALGLTTIGDGSKLDNMVHVGHNCRIGRHVVIAAQTGFSGSVTVEDYAVICGQVGIGDKARIESGAVLGSGCGVLTSKVVRSRQVVWGTPARPLKEHLQQLAHLGRVPEIRAELRKLREQVAALRRTIEGG